MWPGEVPSDLDYEEKNHDQLAGRWRILVDLYSEFQGECGAFLIFAFLIPGLMVASVVFEWIKRPDLMLAIAAAVFVVCITVSLHAYLWFRWVRKRVRRVRELMDRIDYEDEGDSVL